MSQDDFEKRAKEAAQKEYEYPDLGLARAAFLIGAKWARAESEAENEQLRAALEKIKDENCGIWGPEGIAREALEEK